MAQPMINVLNFDMYLEGQTGDGDPESPRTPFRYIDLPRELSKVNRKLYRSCRRYAIAGIQVVAEEGTTVSFFTAPDNWITKNAVKKAFHMWQKMNKQVLENSPSVKPTWHDFKVFLDYTHRQTNGQELQATPDFDYAPYPVGEWVRSQFVFPWTASDGLTSGSTESNIHIVGNHYDNTGANAAFNPATIESLGLIEAYKESRATIPDESPDTGSTPNLHPWVGLFDDGDKFEDLNQNLKDQNDQAPYSVNYYVADNQSPVLYNAAEMRIQSSEVVNMSNGFVAPCGLIKVATNQTSGALRLKVFLVPADNAYGIATEAII